MLFKFNTVFAQSLDFSVNSLPNLGLIYQAEQDFERERVINNAFRVNIRGRNRRLLVTAKAVSVLTNSFTSIPADIFSIKLRNTNSPMGSNYFYKYPLSFIDSDIINHSSNNNRPFFFDYDLYFSPIGYDYEPGQYFYSIIFTITEL